jgi:hypothetical protein
MIRMFYFLHVSAEIQYKPISVFYNMHIYMYNILYNPLGFVG